MKSRILLPALKRKSPEESRGPGHQALSEECLGEATHLDPWEGLSKYISDVSLADRAGITSCFHLTDEEALLPFLQISGEAFPFPPILFPQRLM